MYLQHSVARTGDRDFEKVRVSSQVSGEGSVSADLLQRDDERISEADRNDLQYRKTFDDAYGKTHVRHHRYFGE